jgi:hypothetical protein
MTYKVSGRRIQQQCCIERGGERHTFNASAFFFSSLCPPSAAFFFALKTCWFIRVGGTSDMVTKFLFLVVVNALCRDYFFLYGKGHSFTLHSMLQEID